MTTPPDQSAVIELSERRLLILMRHAKSDWGDQRLADHDRPLNKRGRNDAPRMADWLAEIGVVPDMILSSSSTRTRQTLDLMLPQWNSQPEVSYSDALYLATPETLLRSVRSDGCDGKRLMVVAHNPGITHLVSTLADRSVEMPTAAIAVFELILSDWSKLSSRTAANLVHLMRPKSL